MNLGDCESLPLKEKTLSPSPPFLLLKVYDHRSVHYLDSTVVNGLLHFSFFSPLRSLKNKWQSS